MATVCDISPVLDKPTDRCPECNHFMANHRKGDTCFICAFQVGK